MLAEVTPYPAWNAIKFLPAEMYQVAIVAGKQLVPAVAGKRHGHVLPRHFRDIVGGDHRRISERLFQASRQKLQRLSNVRFNDEFVMLRAETFGHGARIGSFVEILVREANRKCLN